MTKQSKKQYPIIENVTLETIPANQTFVFAPFMVSQLLELCKPYETFDPDTGEIKSKYKYLEGHPRQYRFDAKSGRFNIKGREEVGDTFTFQPFAWRIFTDEILNMGRKNWAELFFIDAQNCVSAILFHGYSVEQLFRLIEPLFYDDLTLADVVITVKPEKKQNTKVESSPSYYIASFEYEKANPQKVEELQAFAVDYKIYRSETLTDVAEIRNEHKFFNPNSNGLNQNPDALLTGEKQPEPEETKEQQSGNDQQQAA